MSKKGKSESIGSDDLRTELEYAPVTSKSNLISTTPKQINKQALNKPHKSNPKAYSTIVKCLKKQKISVP